MKICSSKNCTQENPQSLDRFSKNKNTSDGFQPYCKDCSAKSKKKYRAKDEAKVREKTFQKIYLLQKKYNLSLEDFNLLKLIQDNKCKICGVQSKKTLAVDHNHKDGKVRGLLCRKM